MTDSAEPKPAGPVDRAVDWLDAHVPPTEGWAYGFRIWLASVVALYAAFWFQLDEAYDAAVCVAILAQQRRGQALSKALFRMLGTLVGGVVTIVLMGLFAQERTPLLIFFTLWLGLCCFVAQYLQDTRAYAAILSGYTVAIVALGQINTPQETFEALVARIAAISFGIVFITFINDALGAPLTWRAILPKLSEAAAATCAFARETLARGDLGPERAVAVIGEITALRADVAAIAVEFDDGKFRAAGARSCMAALYVMIATARVIAAASAALDRRSPAVEEAMAICARVAARPDAATLDHADDRLRALVDAAVGDGDRPLAEIVLLQRALDFACAAIFADDGLRALGDGHTPLRSVALPMHRDFALALRNAFRVVLGFAVTAPILVVVGQPQASFALVQVGVFAALASLNPKPATFARGVLIGIILSATLGGFARFFMLYDVGGFPLLAIVMAPPIFIGCFLSLKPSTFGIGFITLVYFPIFLSPSNPQGYDIQSFLVEVLFAILSGFMIMAVTNLVLPTSDAQRRAYALASARRALAEALVGRGDDPTTATSLDADRLTQYASYGSEDPRTQRATLELALDMSRLGAAAMRAHGQLRLLWAVAPMRGIIVPAREALAVGDAAGLERGARDIVRAAAGEPHAVRMATARAVSDLVTAARVIGRRRDFLRGLGIAPF